MWRHRPSKVILIGQMSRIRFLSSENSTHEWESNCHIVAVRTFAAGVKGSSDFNRFKDNASCSPGEFTSCVEGSSVFWRSLLESCSPSPSPSNHNTPFLLVRKWSLDLVRAGLSNTATASAGCVRGFIFLQLCSFCSLCLCVCCSVVLNFLFTFKPAELLAEAVTLTRNKRWNLPKQAKPWFFFF